MVCYCGNLVEGRCTIWEWCSEAAWQRSGGCARCDGRFWERMVAPRRQGWPTMFLGIAGAPACPSPPHRALGFDRVRQTKKNPCRMKNQFRGAVGRGFWHRRPQTVFGGPLGGQVEMLLVPVGGSNRDYRAPFSPGSCHEPGLKACSNEPPTSCANYDVIALEFDRHYDNRFRNH
jgi:hypothetical protein